MDAASDTRLPRLAPLLLIGALIWLAVTRPGNLSGDSALGYRLLTGLTAVVAVGYVAWRFHGILSAAAAIVLLRLADPEQPQHGAFVERGADAVLLATLALGIAAAAQQGRRGRLPWALLAIGAGMVAFFGWYGRELPTAEDGPARARLWHLTAVMTVLAVPIGRSARRATWSDRIRLVGVMLGLPAAGLAAAMAEGRGAPTFAQADWPAVVDEWKATIANHSWDQAAWCWSNSWLAGVLVAIGIWRTVARGHQQVRAGGAPLAWLITVMGVGVLGALGGRPYAAGSLALAATGVLLSAFGAADLIQAIVERIELKPPEPGPSNIPRVK